MVRFWFQRKAKFGFGGGECMVSYVLKSITIHDVSACVLIGDPEL